MIVLETERLVVRHLRPDDLDAFFEICADADVMRYVGDGGPLTRELTELWIANSLANYQKHGFGTFALTLRGGDRVVGYAGLVRPTADGEAEIIYGIEKPLWGRGLMSEAAAALVELGFERFGLRRMIATIDPDNLPSITIAGKLGMKFELERRDEHGLPELLYAVEAA